MQQEAATLREQLSQASAVIETITQDVALLASSAESAAVDSEVLAEHSAALATHKRQEQGLHAALQTSAAEVNTLQQELQQKNAALECSQMEVGELQRKFDALSEQHEAQAAQLRAQEQSAMRSEASSDKLIRELQSFSSELQLSLSVVGSSTDTTSSSFDAQTFISDLSAAARKLRAQYNSLQQELQATAHLVTTAQQDAQDPPQAFGISGVVGEVQAVLNRYSEATDQTAGGDDDDAQASINGMLAELVASLEDVGTPVADPRRAEVLRRVLQGFRAGEEEELGEVAQGFMDLRVNTAAKPPAHAVVHGADTTAGTPDPVQASRKPGAAPAESPASSWPSASTRAADAAADGSGRDAASKYGDVRVDTAASLSHPVRSPMHSPLHAQQLEAEATRLLDSIRDRCDEVARLAKELQRTAASAHAVADAPADVLDRVADGNTQQQLFADASRLAFSAHEQLAGITASLDQGLAVMMAGMNTRVQSLQRENASLTQRLQRSRGNIQVICRVRHPTQHESEQALKEAQSRATARTQLGIDAADATLDVKEIQRQILHGCVDVISDCELAFRDPFSQRYVEVHTLIQHAARIGQSS